MREEGAPRAYFGLARALHENIKIGREGREKRYD